MPVTLPIEVYEAFEKGLGKEEAKIVVKSLETTIEDATANTWAKTKNELLDRLVSKEEFKDLKEELKALREDVRGLDSKVYELNSSINQRIDETNSSINKRIDETNSSINKRIDETNKRIDSVIKIQLWIMGLIAIQAVAVIVKLIFLP